MTSSLSYRELQQLCTLHKVKLPDDVSCREKGLTKKKLIEILTNANVLRPADAPVVSKKNAPVVSKKNDDVWAKMTHVELRSLCMANKGLYDDVPDCRSSSDIIRAWAKKNNVLPVSLPKVQKQESNAKAYTMNELKSICTTNKDKLPEGTLCRGKGVTKNSLYLMLLEAKLLGELKPDNAGAAPAKKKEQAPAKKRKPIVKDEATSPGSFFINDTVCASVTKEFSLDSLLLGETACNTLSERVANTLVTVASSRIFTNPHRSLLELPINSIDAYRSLRKDAPPPVGKFGMGFFSIFYYIFAWDATVEITSNYMDKEAFKATVLLQDDKLRVTYAHLDISSTEKGTQISIIPKSDFKAADLKAFEMQVDSLFDIFDVLIEIYTFDGRSRRTTRFGPGSAEYKRALFHRMPFALAKGLKDTPQTKDKIIIRINPDKVSVQDFASGISKKVLFNYLLSPSVSTKTIKAESGLSKVLKTTNKTGVDIIGTQILYITVNDIVVLKVEPRQSLGLAHTRSTYVLSLPAGISLPVSRDNILVTTDTRDFIQREVNLLVDATIKKLASLTELFALFEELDSNPTTTKELSLILNEAQRYAYSQNHVFASPFMEREKKMMKGVLKLKKEQKVVYAPRYDVRALENLILETHKAKLITDVFIGKTVIPLANASNVFNANLPSILFIPESYLKMERPEWVKRVMGGFTKDSLIEVNTQEKKGKARPQNELDVAMGNANQLIEQLSLYTNVYWRAGGISTARMYDLYYPALESIQAEAFMYFYNTLSSAQLQIPYGGKATVSMNIMNSILPYFAKESKFPPKQTFLRFVKKFQSYNSSLYDTVVDNGIELTLWGFQKDLADLQGTTSAHITFYHPLAFLLYAYWVEKALMSMENTTTVLETVFSVFQHPLEAFVFCGVLLRSTALSDVERIFAQDDSPQARVMSIFRASYVYMTEKYSFEAMYRQITFNKLGTMKDLLVDYIDDGLLMLMKVRDSYLEEKLEELPDGTEFRISALLTLVFNPQRETHDFMDVAKEAEKLSNDPDFDKTQTVGQIVEIAVNEGTTKDYVPAVLTELVQNSYDAYRSLKASDSKNVILTTKNARAEKKVKINGNRQWLQVTDYVGIGQKHFFPLLIPFLSSKDPKDAVTTGEMGTGFFNIYRQPYTKRVFISTSGPDGVFRIQVTPVLDEDQKRVLDLIYRIKKTNNVSKYRYTKIHIDFHDFEAASDERTRMLGIDAENDMVAFITSAIAPMDITTYWNGKKISKNSEVVEKIGSVSAERVHDGQISYLYSKGIPVIPIHSLREKGSEYGSFMGSSLVSFISVGYKIDLLSGSYVPTQGRTELQLPPQTQREIADALYIIMLDALLNYRRFISTYIHRYDSSGPYDQLSVPSTRLAIYTYRGHSIQSLITSAKVALNGRSPDSALLDSILMQKDIHNLQKKYVIGWFIGKSAPVREKKEDEKVVMVAPNTVKTFMNVFVKEFWSLGLELEKEGSVKGTSFSKNATSPIVDFDDLPNGIAGMYEKTLHKIKLDYIKLAEGQLDRDIGTFKRAKNKLASLKKTKALFALIRNVPGGTLIHELTHAWTGTTHTGHVDITLTLGKHQEKYDFEFAGANLFAYMLERGFMDRFVQALVKK